MATMKKGVLTHASEMWKHLRPYGKRAFWKRHRKAEQRDTRTHLRPSNQWHDLRGNQP